MTFRSEGTFAVYPGEIFKLCTFHLPPRSESIGGTDWQEHLIDYRIVCDRAPPERGKLTLSTYVAAPDLATRA